MSNENKTDRQKTEAPKAEAPRNDASNAAPHNPFAAFDPMAVWQAFQSSMNAWTHNMQPMNPVAAWTTAQQSFQKMVTDSYSRAQAWGDEYAAIEQQMVARANAAVDAWAQLAHDSINYTAQLSAQARKLGAEATRRATAGA
jgi:hypothetical protein